jgi:hypothetical protein
VNAARLAARCLALLGPVTGPVVIAAPRAPGLAAMLARRLRVVAAAETPAAAVVVLLRTPARPHERQALLAELRRRLLPGAPLVLVDHSQPRARWRRLGAWVGLALAGLPGSRARYPAARELNALGFAVERLQLACGERVQLVAARR